MTSPTALDAMKARPNPEIDPLTTLIEENAICKLQNYYVISVDAKRWENLKEVFTKDVAADFGPGVGEISGVDRLAATLEAITSPVMAQHHLGSQVVTLHAPTAASCISYVVANQFGKGEHEGKPLYAFVRYDDQLTKFDEGWKITARVLSNMGPYQGDVTIFGRS